MLRHSVMILNDLKLIRLGVATMFQESPLMLVAEAETVAQAREILQTQPLDLLLMEARLANHDILSALQEFKRDYPQLPILVFSSHDYPTVLARSNHYGASGFIRMTADRETVILMCLQAIRHENLWTSDDLRRVSMSHTLQSSDVEHDVPLTRREVQILRYLCRGNSNKEIAVRLEISGETVKEHVQHILRKLKVGDRTQAAIWATRLGLFYD
jgi:DNA-binding NarL/FixJ family response regulator